MTDRRDMKTKKYEKKFFLELQLTSSAANNYEKEMSPCVLDFDELKTAHDLCGFSDFYEHFEASLDNEIVEFYKRKSGIEIPVKKPNSTYLTSRIVIPKDLALKYPLRGDDLVDSEEFIRNYEPKKYKTEGCIYNWVCVLISQNDY